MVHALDQAHRVLRPRGYVADLRPDSGTRRLPDVYCLIDGQRLRAGSVQETMKIEDYAAADRAVAWVAERGLFGVVVRQRFRFRYYFDSPDLLEEFLAENWIGARLAADVRRRIRAVCRLDPSARLTIDEPVQLTVLAKI